MATVTLANAIGSFESGPIARTYDSIWSTMDEC